MEIEYDSCIYRLDPVLIWKIFCTSGMTPLSRQRHFSVMLSGMNERSFAVCLIIYNMTSKKKKSGIHIAIATGRDVDSASLFPKVKST